MRVLAVFGTRPEAIKMAPLVRLLQQDQQIKCQVAVTAQHREMLDQVLQLFAIRPDYDLNIMQPGQTLYDITSRVLQGLGQILAQNKPDLVLVHGDTTTTFATALAAYYAQVPVGHVEAGLRTHNKYAPFPEEINRRLACVLGDWHFAPTQLAADNLAREGVGLDRVFITGNTVIDALLDTVQQQFTFGHPLLDSLDFNCRRVILMTTHRRENLGEPMREIYSALREVLRQHQDVQVVFPVHKNPRVRQIVEQMLGDLPQVHLIEPLDYQPFVNLMSRCHLVLTDSGGLQEEAPALGKPVLVLRHTTERPEAVRMGTVELVGTNHQQVLEATQRLLTQPEHYQRMAEAVNPYGDGQAAGRIVQAIKFAFELIDEPPRHFVV